MYCILKMNEKSLSYWNATNCKNRPIVYLISCSYLNMAMEIEGHTYNMTVFWKEMNWEKGWNDTRKKKKILVPRTMQCSEAVRQSVYFQLKLQFCCFRIGLKTLTAWIDGPPALDKFMVLYFWALAVCTLPKVVYTWI